MNSLYQSHLVPAGMSSLLRNLYHAKANIQIQKAGMGAWIYTLISARF
jgi:hypothetical protein